jgi:hypothetical protein
MTATSAPTATVFNYSYSYSYRAPEARDALADIPKKVAEKSLQIYFW